MESENKSFKCGEELALLPMELQKESTNYWRQLVALICHSCDLPQQLKCKSTENSCYGKKFRFYHARTVQVEN